MPGTDTQDRHLVAAGVDCEQVAPVARHLERTLRTDGGSCSSAARAEGRAFELRQRAITMPLESRDGVRACCVVVD